LWPQVHSDVLLCVAKPAPAFASEYQLPGTVSCPSRSSVVSSSEVAREEHAPIAGLVIELGGGQRYFNVRGVTRARQVQAHQVFAVVLLRFLVHFGTITNHTSSTVYGWPSNSLSVRDRHAILMAPAKANEQWQTTPMTAYLILSNR
jgi:hypothetical protein